MSHDEFSILPMRVSVCWVAEIMKSAGVDEVTETWAVFVLVDVTVSRVACSEENLCRVNRCDSQVARGGCSGALHCAWSSWNPYDWPAGMIGVPT